MTANSRGDVVSGERQISRDQESAQTKPMSLWRKRKYTKDLSQDFRRIGRANEPKSNPIPRGKPGWFAMHTGPKGRRRTIPRGHGTPAANPLRLPSEAKMTRMQKATSKANFLLAINPLNAKIYNENRQIQ